MNAHCTYCEASLQCRRCGKPVRSKQEFLTVAQAEERAILAAVAQYGNLVAAAKALGIGKTTIYRKMKGLEGNKP